MYHQNCGTEQQVKDPFKIEKKKGYLTVTTTMGTLPIVFKKYLFFTVAISEEACSCSSFLYSEPEYAGRGGQCHFALPQLQNPSVEGVLERLQEGRRKVEGGCALQELVTG